MITQTGTIYQVPLEQTMPPALERDQRVVALIKALAKQHQKTAKLIQEHAGIFYRIEELDELLLDILATDLHVDWYDYGADLSEKRKIIKNSIQIHRMAGTPAGLRLAIESTHNEIVLEEWFEYGGEPYFFRVGVNVDSDREINQGRLLGIVRTYKPVRAHLEDDAIAFRSVENISVGFTCGFVIYDVPRCGTVPGPATVGGIGTSNIIIRAEPGGTAYSTPKTGTAVTGTHPKNSTVGAITVQNIEIETGASGDGYSTPKTGTAVTGTHPKNSTVGAAAQQDVMISGETVGIGYATPKTGTAITGTHPVQTTVGGTALQGISVEGDAQGTEYTVPKSGTVPGPATAGAAGESGMKASVTGDGTTYSGPVCGGNNLF